MSRCVRAGLLVGPARTVSWFIDDPAELAGRAPACFAQDALVRLCTHHVLTELASWNLADLSFSLRISRGPDGKELFPDEVSDDNNATVAVSRFIDGPAARQAILDAFHAAAG